MDMRPTVKTIAYLALIAAAASTAGCAGRNAAPVLASKADDVDRTCHQLLKEEAQNEQWMKHLVLEDKHIHQANSDILWQDTVLWTSFWTPPVPSPGVIALDYKDAPGKEIRAFQARNVVLNKLATDKGC